MQIYGRNICPCYKKVFDNKVVDNVFNDISYGTNINRIETATIEVILHTVKSSIIPKFPTVIYLKIVDASLISIYLHVKRLLKLVSEDRSGE